MSQPIDWHIDAALSNYAQKYGQGSFSWAVMAPVVPVPKMSNKFIKWGREEIRYADVKPRAPRTRHNQIRFGATTGSYTTAEYGITAPLDWSEMANADEQYNPEGRAVELVKAQVNMRFEADFKALATTSGSFGTSNAAAAAWVSASYTQIRGDIDTGAEGVIVKSGMQPTHLLLGPVKARELARNPGIIDIVKYLKGPDLIADGSLPKTFMGLTVVVPGVIGETAVEGQTSSPARLWTNTTAIVAAIDPTPSTDKMTWMSTWTWTAFPGSAGGERVRYWDDVPTQTREHEYAAHRSIDVVASQCAAQITGI